MAVNEGRYRRAERAYWTSEGIAPSERYVELPEGNRVRVQETGEGRPALFVHGGGASGANFAPLLTRLPTVRCMALDRPGCGLSDPIPNLKPLRHLDALNAYADRMLVEVLDALELETADVVATSFGGLFTFRAAAAHPDRFRRIAIVAWPMGAPMASVPISMRMGMIPGLRELMLKIPPTRSAIKMILRQLGLSNALELGKISDEMIEWFLSLLRDTNTLASDTKLAPDVFTPIKGPNEAMYFTDDLIKRITAPVLFQWGSADPMGGTEIAREFAGRFTTSTLEIVPDSGHAPWLDQPDLIASRIATFLD